MNTKADSISPRGNETVTGMGEAIARKLVNGFCNSLLSWCGVYIPTDMAEKHVQRVAEALAAAHTQAFAQGAEAGLEAAAAKLDELAEWHFNIAPGMKADGDEYGADEHDREGYRIRELAETIRALPPPPAGKPGGEG